MDRALSLTLPNAALRALAESYTAQSPDESLLELTIRAVDQDINVREFSAYLAFLDGVYGRLDPAGFRSYAQQPSRQLEIRYLGRGSIDLLFLFDLFGLADAWRALLIYLIARAGPSILRGEAVKNWAEAGKTVAETYRLLRPGEPGQSEAQQQSGLRLTRRQRRHLRNFIRDDPQFAGLSDRHITQLISLVEQLLASEQHHLPAALRFSERYVQDVALRRRGRK
ncbi:MAG: hypothetical protein H0W11_08450 [Gemmatimonadetes bacterium]|nr:hypothetical protein [Gemmatimonadota bacterium]